MEMSFDLHLLDLAVIKEMVEYKRDDGLFNEVDDPEERALFDFRQTSQRPLLLASSQRDNRPVVIISCSGNLSGGNRKDYNLKHYFQNTSTMIDALVNDSKIFNQVFIGKAIIVGVGNQEIKPKALPAELLIRLKREVVLSRLSSGKKGRLLSVERAIQQEVRDNITKIAAHNGADEVSDTVKTEFVWMSITTDGLRGTVQTGPYKDRSLNSMTPDELRTFHNECKHDEDSKSLIEAYFEHIDFDDFRKKKDWGRRKSQTDNSMSIEEACKT